MTHIHRAPFVLSALLLPLAAVGACVAGEPQPATPEAPPPPAATEAPEPTAEDEDPPAPAPTPEASGDCSSDADCVQATCCHATACVPKSQAPKCDEVACTDDCQPGTLDCGGRCACQAGKCVAEIEEKSSPPTDFK